MRNDAPAAGPRLFSVGHSNHDLPAFLGLLRQNGVTALADVRSVPHSRRQPQFNREELERALSDADILYVFLGERLGGRPRSRDLYDDEGRVDYEKVRGTDFFRQGLDRLVCGLDEHTIAMMCGEADPLDCHRGLMIAPALVERGIAPGHIRKDGSVETTAEMERRLLAATRKESGMIDGLFAGIIEVERQRLLADAYRAMARKKAFRGLPQRKWSRG
jgi:uncharacterized protein (DUF488 family)